MQKKSLTLIALLVSYISYSQKFYSADIINKADSLMKTVIGERVFKEYLHYDSSSSYEFKDFRGKSKWKSLVSNKRTKGILKSVEVRYLFCLNKYGFHCLYSIIEFDSLLNQKGNTETSFIPDYILNNTACNFITDTTAINIAKSKFTQKGIKPISATLNYNHFKNIYIWTVDNILTKNIDGFGEPFGKVQFITINALNGEIIDFYPDGVYGAVR